MKNFFQDWAQEHHKGEKSSLPVCLDELARLILQTRCELKEETLSCLRITYCLGAFLWDAPIYTINY